MIVLTLVGETPWKVAGRIADLSYRGMIMGVLNVTPDSFSDGGEFFDCTRAVAHMRRMASEGAQIVDLGGESTRPGAKPVTAADEIARVLPVLEQLRGTSSPILSIDTTKAEVARAALQAGASIINDVSGGTADEAMFGLAAETGAAMIVMHMQGTPQTMQLAPQYGDVVAEVADFFRQQYSRALRCGIDPMCLAFDLGIGFGKTLEHNLTLLRNLPALRIENRPLVVGVSRKSFLARLVGAAELADRRSATVAFTAIMRTSGANVLRVHDVKENVHALRVAEALMEAAQ
ncbi:MAG: dihydropteroate synthase [Chthoniobacterales bacterium]